jgi:hypothetical protein
MEKPNTKSIKHNTALRFSLFLKEIIKAVMNGMTQLYALV